MEKVLKELEDINQKLEGINNSEQTGETKMLNVNETAQFLKISSTKVYELMRQKQIPFIKAGRRKLIPKNMLLDWISQNAKDNKASVKSISKIGGQG